MTNGPPYTVQGDCSIENDEIKYVSFVYNYNFAVAYKYGQRF